MIIDKLYLSISYMPKYFHFHIDTDEQIHHFDAQLSVMPCTFVKADGEQCKNRVCIGQPYCWLHERIGNNLKISKSLIDKAGLGLFAYNGTENKDIVFKKGEHICPFYGEIIDQNELMARYADKTAPYAVEIKQNKIYEDGALQRGIGSLINHNPKKKNCRFSKSKQKKINIVALKNIRNGDELYVSYGRKYRMKETNTYSSTNFRKFSPEIP